MSALCCSGAFISIRLIGSREPALVMSVWFHATSLASCIVPLLISYPSPAVWPSPADSAILLEIAVTSFFGQMVLSRGFQLQAAAKASAINLTQVRPSLSELPSPSIQAQHASCNDAYLMLVLWNIVFHVQSCLYLVWFRARSLSSPVHFFFLLS